MSRTLSELEKVRLMYKPRIPRILTNGIGYLLATEGARTVAVRDGEAIQQAFPATYGKPVLRLTSAAEPRERRPLTVGVVLSGGQAPGGHNVIAGLFDSLTEFHPDSCLYGFLGGPSGIFTKRYRPLSADTIEPFRNTGGFDMIGSGRDKIETPEQFAASLAVCAELKLDGLVVIGGDDSNTNAAVLAEYFSVNGSKTVVAGVPKTIDGDMKSDQIEISFGFDTATKLYSELIGNLCRDTRSAQKYWHFIKLMGRVSSHVTLECALQTQANVVLIGEEVEARKMTLAQVVDQIATVVFKRAEQGRQYGVCLIPEGIIEFIPEIQALIAELNEILSSNATAQHDVVSGKLSQDSRHVFSSLPPRIQQQLLLDRDSHGNVQVSRIDTEQLLLEQVNKRLAERKFPGKFQYQHHFFGYEGRATPPSNFDANYTYGLGAVAAALISLGRTGYICSLQNLVGSPEDWQAVGVPLTSMMQTETRGGKAVPVIAKALVRIDTEPFLTFAADRAMCEIEDAYLYPGPVQYFGPPEVADRLTCTLLLEHGLE
jgi:pyrophosphate--fructose-6-phosphate 1-phosphotransferase